MIRQAEAAVLRQPLGAPQAVDGRTGPRKAHKSFLILCR